METKGIKALVSKIKANKLNNILVQKVNKNSLYLFLIKNKEKILVGTIDGEYITKNVIKFITFKDAKIISIYGFNFIDFIDYIEYLSETKDIDKSLTFLMNYFNIFKIVNETNPVIKKESLKDVYPTFFNQLSKSKDTNIRI